MPLFAPGMMKIGEIIYDYSGCCREGGRPTLEPLSPFCSLDPDVATNPEFGVVMVGLAKPRPTLQNTARFTPAFSQV
jgi:hypothetical protein